MGNLRDKYTNEEWDNILAKSKKRSEFFDIPQQIGCRDREHNPPTHLYVPPNKEYNHVCPSCGHVHIIRSPQYTL